MNTIEAKQNRPKQAHRQTYRVRLPGFISDKEVGAGDVVKRVANVFGIKPNNDCGCERRAAALNRWLVFTPRRPK